MKPFVRILFVLFCLAIVALQAAAQFSLPHYEPFNYTTGQALGSQSGWTQLASGSDSIMIAAGSLSYPGYASSSGNKITFDGTGDRVATTFSTVDTSVFRTVYYSFLLNVTSIGVMDTTGGYFAGFYNSPTLTTTMAVLYINKNDNSTYKLRIRARLSPSQSSDSITLSINTTYLIVAAYKFVPGALNDSAKLWINPDASTFGGSEPPPTAKTINTSTADMGSVARILFRQDGATRIPFMQIDELRIDTTWAGVTTTTALPVQLTSFSAAASVNSARLAWSTATEVDCYGFAIERRAVGTDAWANIGFVAGAGTTNASKSYSYTVAEGSYVYRLKQIDNSGMFKYYGNAEVSIQGPKEFRLYGNYPNPFNPTTQVKFSVANDAQTTLKIFNMLGQQVATLFDGVAIAGKAYEVPFNASGLSTGIYFSRLESEGKQVLQKMMLLK